MLWLEQFRKFNYKWIHSDDKINCFVVHAIPPGNKYTTKTHCDLATAIGSRCRTQTRINHREKSIVVEDGTSLKPTIFFSTKKSNKNYPVDLDFDQEFTVAREEDEDEFDPDGRPRFVWNHFLQASRLQTGQHPSSRQGDGELRVRRSSQRRPRLLGARIYRRIVGEILLQAPAQRGSGVVLRVDRVSFKCTKIKTAIIFGSENYVDFLQRARHIQGHERDFEHTDWFLHMAERRASPWLRAEDGRTGKSDIRGVKCAHERRPRVDGVCDRSF